MEFGDWSGDHVSVRSPQQCGVGPVSSAPVLFAAAAAPCVRRLCVPGTPPAWSSLFPLLTSKSGTSGTLPNVSALSRTSCVDSLEVKIIYWC